MFEAKVTVMIPGLPEAINALAGALAGAGSNQGYTAQSENATAPAATEATPAPVVNPIPAGATQTAPASVPTAPYPTAVPTGATNPAPAAPVVSVEDLGRAGAALIDAGKMPQLIELLGRYGVQAITQLKPEMLAPFADELRALGAKF